MAPFTGHVISNTHWDREWRYPFQAYRTDLVDLMDNLLDLLERRPDYRSFLLDSQTIILEDYLEIRPENADRIRHQAAAGRLQIGPWYTLPDEWGCPSEALVRNLLVGHRVGQRYGPIFKVGYTPFSNGQISQLPQLYREFGIDSAFFYRGINKVVADSEFVWKGADGSWLYTFKFGDFARYNYYYLVYRPGLLGRTLKDREYGWEPDQVPYHVATEQSQDRQYGWLNLTLRVHREHLEQAIADVREWTTPGTATSHLLYMMGHDHSHSAEEELDLVDALAEATGQEGGRIIHSSLDDYLEHFRAEAKDLQVLQGEMRYEKQDGLWTDLMANILSSRSYLKQRNAAVNTQIIHVAEPLAAIAWMGGSEYPVRYLDIAWKKILANQAHDAIGGCSVDRVHDEMLVRWDEVETIGEELQRRAMRETIARLDGTAISPDCLQLTVFNTLATRRSDLAEFLIDLPGAKAEATFSLETLAGEVIEYQEIEREPYTATIESPVELPMTMNVTRIRAAVALKHLPAMGHTALVVKPGAKPRASKKSLIASGCELENKSLKVRLNENGTVRIEDKRTGQVFDQLGMLEDTASFGDPWSLVRPKGDRAITSQRAKASVRVVREGALESTLRAEYLLRVPACEEGGKRSRKKVAILVAVEVTLRRDSDQVFLNLEFDNIARDHRMRILFPTGLNGATHSTADGQYDVLSRPIALPEAKDWKEKPYSTKPMWSWVDLSDGENGLGVISQGLIEYEAIDDANRTVAVTLLRAFGKFVFGRPTPGAQCPGPRSYRFALVPHRGDWRSADLTNRSLRFSVPIQAMLSAPTLGKASLENSLLELGPSSLVLGGIKKGEEGDRLVVRFWNPLDEAQNAEIRLGFKATRVERLTMEEKRSGEPAPKLIGKKIVLRVPAKKIVTLGIWKK